MRKIVILLMISVALLSGCSLGVRQDIPKNKEPDYENENPGNKSVDIIDADGNTLESRIKTPEGFKRGKASGGSLLVFIRDQKLKPDGSPVMLHSGSKKSNQTAHIAVFDMDVGSGNLQQCADSVMRIYAEYYWSLGDYESIAFHLTNGFLMEYSKWREGKRLEVSGNNVRWVKKAGYDDSYEGFRKYLEQVHVYAGTLSLYRESHDIALEDMEAGDMLIRGGSPGHVVLVLDVAEDESGNKCFLLGQGYMPAQDFHVLKNPLHPDDPWYYVSEMNYPIRTPEYSFDEGTLREWDGF